jgi:hypothetical protein
VLGRVPTRLPMIRYGTVGTVLYFLVATLG